MSSNIRVSALMSVYNGETYLAAALDSMLAELGPDDETIVVDDGSTDGTATILARYDGRITVLRQPNSGTATALNRALGVARGEFIAFNDADDLWEPGRVERQLAALRNDSLLEAVFGTAIQFVSPELPPDLQARFAPPIESLAGVTIPCMMARASLLRRLGPFDESLRVTFGYAFTGLLKVQAIRTAMLEDIVLRRRLHEHNWSRLNRHELKTDTLKSLRDQIRRRRDQQG